MEQTWRWHGPNDLVSLANVRQAGVTGVVTALHYTPGGEIWSVKETLKRKTIIEDVGLVWSVVESVPIHGDIKTHTDNREQWIANYQQIPRNLAQCDIRIVCYNFIPVLGRTHTDLKYVLSDGSKALRSNQIESAAFEIHALKRPGAEADYTEEEIAQAVVRPATMSDEDKVHLTRNIIAGPPGAEEGYTLDQFRKHLKLYKDTNRAKPRENFAVFLKAAIPVAEGVGMRMAVHPDDPPHPILDLPRIVPTIEDVQWMVDTVNSMANGFTMCTGFYGVRAGSDLVDMIKQLGPRIYFTYLYSIIREDNPKTSHKTTYLDGNINMYEVVKTIVEEEHRRKAGGKEDLILVRPDRGHRMLSDLGKKANPGYSAIGCLRGLAEVRDVELTIQRAFFSR